MDTKEREALADAIVQTLQSVNVSDSNLEPANVVDVISHLSSAVVKVANAVASPVPPGIDAAGGTVDCLTEAVMGVTAGLFEIAHAIDRATESEEG